MHISTRHFSPVQWNGVRDGVWCTVRCPRPGWRSTPFASLLPSQGLPRGPAPPRHGRRGGTGAAPAVRPAVGGGGAAARRPRRPPRRPAEGPAAPVGPGAVLGPAPAGVGRGHPAPAAPPQRTATNHVSAWPDLICGAKATRDSAPTVGVHGGDATPGDPPLSRFSRSRGPAGNAAPAVGDGPRLRHQCARQGPRALRHREAHPAAGDLHCRGPLPCALKLVLIHPRIISFACDYPPPPGLLQL